MSNKYKMRYSIKIEKGQFSKDDVLNDEHGLADEIILFSILHGSDGSYSQAIIDRDSNGNPLDQQKLFKAWMILAEAILDRGGTSDSTKEFLLTTVNIFRELKGFPLRGVESK